MIKAKSEKNINMKQFKKLNICVITHPITTVVGAAILSNFIDILEPLSNELFVITGKFPDRQNKKIHIIRIRSDDKKEFTFIRAVKYMFKQLRIVFNLIKISKDIDIVIFYIGTGIDVLPVLAAKVMRKRTIKVATGSSSKTAETDNRRLFGLGTIIFPSIFKFLERINYALSDQIGIAMESKSIIRFLGLEKYRTKIVPLGVYFLNTNFKIKKRLNERENIIGYVGRLSEEKGVIELARAIPLLLSKRNNIRFLIVGNGRLMENMKDVLSKAECLEKVNFVGWTPHEKIPDYLNEMKFHILPSHTEAFGGAAIEAMACGAISIANSVGGLPDIIKDGETGFLLKDNQPQTIANKVLDVWDNPKLEKIQKNAKEFVDKTFSYEAAVERCEKAFSDLVEA